MILNKEFLIKKICEIIYDNTYDDEEPSYMNDFEDLHDTSVYIKIGDSIIEEYDMLYWEMCSILNQETDDICDCVNDFIDEQFQSYYGDPAFASAKDYWGYILG